ncbi:MAG: DinB family protein [Candidatus Acidiferrales bacterium]
MNPEQAAFVAEMYTQGLEREYAVTRRIIAAVPEDNKHYRPDDNARTAFELASHIATSEVWFLNGIAKGEFVRGTPKEFGSVAEISAYYDKEFPAALAKVRALPAEKLANNISFAIFNMPAVAYLGFVNNHSIHHRGQLAVYLRPMGSKVPGIYGPSYYEPMPAPKPAAAAN